jgi:putative DNA primase/helicase
MGARPNWEQVVPSKYAALPRELLVLPQWVVWKRVMKPGASKATKIPYSARTGVPASTTDPLTWATFDEAAAAKTANDAYTGIGFVFTAGDPYVGIDLDKCIDPASGELTAEAKSIVTAIDSYTERTPSGNGLHIIARGTLPAGGRKKGDIEMYDAGRYFTMTGDSWPDTNCVIEDRPAELCALHQRVFGHSKPSKSPAPAMSPASGASDQTDDQVLPAIRVSSSASKFEQLFAGDWPLLGYSSQSEADLALAGILAKFTGGDAVQIDRLFRTSGLYRDKWDEQHGEKTMVRRRSPRRWKISWTAMIAKPRMTTIMVLKAVSPRPWPSSTRSSRWYALGTACASSKNTVMAPDGLKGSRF